MKEFEYTIKNEIGIHGRPAVELVKIGKAFPGTTVTVTKGDRSVDITRLMMLMGLGVVKDDTVTFRAEGNDEEKAIEAVREFALKEL